MKEIKYVRKYVVKSKKKYLKKHDKKYEQMYMDTYVISKCFVFEFFYLIHCQLLFAFFNINRMWFIIFCCALKCFTALRFHRNYTSHLLHNHSSLILPQHMCIRWKYTKITNNHSVKNSVEFVNKIKSLSVLPQYKLMLFDIVNLYTNVAVPQTMDILQKVKMNILNQQKI